MGTAIEHPLRQRQFTNERDRELVLEFVELSNVLDGWTLKGSGVTPTALSESEEEEMDSQGNWLTSGGRKGKSERDRCVAVAIVIALPGVCVSFGTHVRFRMLGLRSVVAEESRFLS